MKDSGYYTLKGYALKNPGELTGAMEDYLEMVCRMARAGSPARIGSLAEGLNVRPSSASKMVAHLRELGLVEFEPYGAAVLPTAHGRAVGEYLLWRHQVLHRFLCLVNQTESELELAEKIEHFLDRRTVENLARLMQRICPDEDCKSPPPLL